MAATPKRKMDDRESEDISGYVHSVSDVTTAANSQTRYFHGQFQSEHDRLIRFVCFSPEKHSAMKSAETTKSPVRINNCVMTPKGDSMELMVRKNSQISICKKLDFARSTRTESSARFMTLSSIETANTMCSVKGKVASVSTTTLVQTRYGQRQVQNVTIVDETKSMVLALWQQHVDKVKAKHFYAFENLISTVFAGELQLSTTTKSVFRSIDEFVVTEEEDKSVKVTQSVGSVVCCSLKATSKCLNCNKALDSDTTSGIVRCHHCSAKQKVTQTNLTRTLSLQLESQSTIHKFVVFNDVLNSFLVKNNLTSMNNDEIEQHILCLDEVVISHNSGSDVVLQLDVKKEQDM